MERQSSSFDLSSRLKTRKLLGVAGGERHHSVSKITQIIGCNTINQDEEIDWPIWLSNCAVAVITFTLSVLMLIGTRPYGAWVFHFLTYTIPSSQVEGNNTNTAAEILESRLLQESLIIRHYGAVYMVVAMSLFYGLSSGNRNSFQFVQFTAVAYQLTVLLAYILTGQWGTVRCSLFLLLLIGYLTCHVSLLVRTKPGMQGIRRRLSNSQNWAFWRWERAVPDPANPSTSISVTAPNGSKQPLSMSEKERVD